MLPFSAEVFFALIAHYNGAIWPAQIVGYVLGIAALALAFRPSPAGSRIIAGILATFWLWTGISYHLVHFSPIDFLAPVYGAAFIVQGLLFAWRGTLREKLAFDFRADLRGRTGVALALYALFLYPLTNVLAGHAWPQMPVFAVAPSPTVIFTFGLLLLCNPGPPWHLLVIPVLWAITGGSAAWLLGVPEDAAMPLAGLAAVVVLLTGKPGPGAR